MSKEELTANDEAIDKMIADIFNNPAPEGRFILRVTEDWLKERGFSDEWIRENRIEV